MAARDVWDVLVRVRISAARHTHITWNMEHGTWNLPARRSLDEGGELGTWNIILSSRPKTNLPQADIFNVKCSIIYGRRPPLRALRVQSK
jgi:hypothetical protein